MTSTIENARAEPLPMCDPDSKIMLLWSAKAGCTFAVKWFLWQVGQLDKAQSGTQRWVHDYRSRNFSLNDDHRRILAQARANPEWRFVWFVRDPVKRAVSAYLAYTHAAATASQVAAHRRVLSSIGKFLRRKVSGSQTFTFREFLQWIASIPEEKLDMHVTPQSVNDYWIGDQDVAFIRIEYANVELAAVEKRLKLPHSESTALSASSHHTQGKRVECMGISELWFGESIRSPVPTYASFIDAGTAPLIKEIYGNDLACIGYLYPESLGHLGYEP